jgi:hypothetical protein
MQTVISDRSTKPRSTEVVLHCMRGGLLPTRQNSISLNRAILPSIFVRLWDRATLRTERYHRRVVDAYLLPTRNEVPNHAPKNTLGSLDPRYSAQASNTLQFFQAFVGRSAAASQKRLEKKTPNAAMCMYIIHLYT